MGHEVQTKCTYTYVCGFLSGQTLLSSANVTLIGGKDDSVKRSTLV